MKSCSHAGLLAAGALLVASVFSACGETPHVDVPALTTAAPGRTEGPASDAADAAPPPALAVDPREAPVKAKFVDVPAKLDAYVCQRVLVTVVKGKVTALNETLGVGDVLVVTHGEPFEAKGGGTVLWAQVAMAPCHLRERPASEKVVIRASAAPKLEWAHGAMNAHLDVVPEAKTGASPSPEVYTGRLEGTAAVGEHAHAGSWEILAAVEAKGTFVLDGTEGPLAPRQIVMVPPGVKHAWKPEAGAKLVAVQMYFPPGPEQRFKALVAAEKGEPDAGAGGGAAKLKDAGSR